MSVSGPLICDDMTFLQDAAVAGAGIALLPIEICSDALAAEALVRLLPRYAVGGSGSGLYLRLALAKARSGARRAVRQMISDEIDRA